jgi:hypothetical protein
MNPHYLRFGYRFSCLLACCLFLAAAWSYFAPEPGPAVDVADRDVEIADAYAQQDREVVFQVQNRSRSPVRVLGMAQC